MKTFIGIIIGIVLAVAFMKYQGTTPAPASVSAPVAAPRASDFFQKLEATFSQAAPASVDTVTSSIPRPLIVERKTPPGMNRSAMSSEYEIVRGSETTKIQIPKGIPLERYENKYFGFYVPKYVRIQEMTTQLSKTLRQVGLHKDEVLMGLGFFSYDQGSKPMLTLTYTHLSPDYVTNPYFRDMPDYFHFSQDKEFGVTFVSTKYNGFTFDGTMNSEVLETILKTIYVK